MHCHLADSCPQDGWIDDDGDRAFIVYSIHPFEGLAAAVGFAVDVHGGIVVASRLIVHMPEGVLSRPIESLRSCEGRHFGHQHDPQPVMTGSRSSLPLARSAQAVLAPSASDSD